MSHLHRSMHRALVRLEGISRWGGAKEVQAAIERVRDVLRQMNNKDAKARIARKDTPWTDPSFQRRVAALLMAVACPEACTQAITEALPARASEMLDEIQGHVPAAPSSKPALTLGMP